MRKYSVVFFESVFQKKGIWCTLCFKENFNKLNDFIIKTNSISIDFSNYFLTLDLLNYKFCVYLRETFKCDLIHWKPATLFLNKKKKNNWNNPLVSGKTMNYAIVEPISYKQSVEQLYFQQFSIFLFQFSSFFFLFYFVLQFYIFSFSN